MRRKKFNALFLHASCLAGLFALHLLIERSCGTLNEDTVSVLPTVFAKYSPSFYRGDPQIPSQRGYFTILYDLYYGLLLVFSEKWVHVLLLFASSAIFFTAVYVFALRAFSSTGVACLSVLLLQFPHTIMGDGATLEIGGFYAESFGRALGIFSLSFLFVGNIWMFAVFVFLGFYIHAMSAVWTLATGMGIFVLSGRWREIGQTLLVGVVLLGVFMVQYFAHSPTETVPWELITKVARWRSAHHIFPLSWDLQQVGVRLLCFLVTSGVICVILKRARVSLALDFFVKFLSITLLLWVAGLVFTEWIPLPMMYSFQFLRASSFQYIVVLIFLAQSLLLVYRNGPYKILSFLVTSLVFYFFFRGPINSSNIAVMILFLGYALGWQKLKLSPAIRSLFEGKPKPVFLLLCALTASALFVRRIYYQGIFRTPYQLNWKESLLHSYGREFLEAAEWARTHTEMTARFITPPWEIGFRYFSKRPVLLNWKDGGIIILNPTVIKVFLETFDAYGFRPPDPPKFERITSVDILRVGRRFQVDYALIPNTRVSATNANTVYQNDKWRIIRLRHDF